MERRHVNEIVEIIYRLRRGEKIREIARDLCFARNTVRKYRDLAEQHGLLEPESPVPDGVTLGRLLGPPPQPRHMRSTVEPYAEFVKQQHKAGVEQAAIWQRLRDEYGYQGSYSSVRRYVKREHPKEVEPVCRIESKPGEEAQVDFGYAGTMGDARTGRMRKVWVFVMTLSFSRHQYIEFVMDQKMRTWLRCHENAFRSFNGVPERVVIDNLKSGVISAALHDPVLAEGYRRLARHYGFLISPNRPRTPRHKGKVESGVHYVKRSFLAGRTFVDLESMNRRGREWVMEIAGMRCHGTTKEAPLLRFEIEKEALQPLPEEDFDLIDTYRAKVHQDCHVVVDGRYYSVPYKYIGDRVDVYVGQRLVEIYHGTELIATHPTIEKKGSRETRLEHYPEDKRAYLENPPERCAQRAQGIGEHCRRLVDELFSDRVQDRLRSVQSLLRLREKVGKERLEAACRRALEYGDGSYRRVKAILEAGREQEPCEVQTPLPTASHSYRYARPVAAFLGGSSYDGEHDEHGREVGS